MLRLCSWTGISILMCACGWCMLLFLILESTEEQFVWQVPISIQPWVLVPMVSTFIQVTFLTCIIANLRVVGWSWVHQLYAIKDIECNYITALKTTGIWKVLLVLCDYTQREGFWLELSSPFILASIIKCKYVIKYILQKYK